MKAFVISLLLVFLVSGCEIRKGEGVVPLEKVEELLESITITELFQEKPITAEDIKITKELLFDKYTLENVYPYKDTVRSIKWDVIKKCLAYVENMDTLRIWNPNRVNGVSYRTTETETVKHHWSRGLSEMNTSVYRILWEWKDISLYLCTCCPIPLPQSVMVVTVL